MSMTDRRTRAQAIASVVVIAALVWALVFRDDPTLGRGQAVVGWLMVAGLAGYLVLVWRRRG